MIGSLEAALVTARCTDRRWARHAPLAAMVLAGVGALHAQPAADLPKLAADYVRAFVGQLSNVVAQEDFEFRRPKPVQIRSDLLLVQYPGSQRDLLTFRDVSSVNGTAQPNREERLTDLFVRSFDDAKQRAAEIAADGAWYVPVVLNPLFAIAFLQADYQHRFKFSEKDAGRDWPKGVRALTFVETVRPTLLQSRSKSQPNVFTRGTAWIEVQTGRILQTELEVRDGNIFTKLVTKFGMDERLKVMVPIEMRTDNPDGIAKYSNFRRFDVKTDEELQLQKQEVGGRK